MNYTDNEPKVFYFYFFRPYVRTVKYIFTQFVKWIKIYVINVYQIREAPIFIKIKVQREIRNKIIFLLTIYHFF